MDRTEARAHLTGPISSIRTPFNRDGSVDYEGLRRQIDTVIANGSKTVLLTAGDSHYLCLGDEEIAEITRVTCEQTTGRAMTVAADRWHSTDRSVEFARYARSVGADVVMVLPPNWGPSVTPETLTEHYRTISQEMPVMIVTGLFSAQGPAFGLETIERTLDQCDNVVAIKDDLCGDFARRLCLLAHDRVPVFAGGQKVNHMNMWPYGCDGFMSTYLTFAPEITWKYWNAVQEKDLEAARAVIRDYDMPFFDFLPTFTGGWNAAVHGTLELFGVCGRWRRPPYYSLEDTEMERLAEFFRDKGLGENISWKG